MSEVIVGDGNQTKITQKMLEDAGADARFLMENSPIISKLVGIDVIARQLFLLIRSATDAEIKNNWDIEQPDLVIRTLGMSAERKAVDDPVTAVQLRDMLLLNVIPVIDIFCRMEEENAAAGPTGSVLVSGADDSTQEQLGQLHGSPTGDTQQQA